MNMLNRLAWVLIATALLAGMAFWIYRYTENERQIRKLEQEKAHLQQIVQRLTSQKRLAEMIVTGKYIKDGMPKMDLLFIEYARDEKSAASIRSFTIDGSEAHLDAKVICFDRSFVFEGDPLRGTSVAVFTRIFGDKQAPEKGTRIDPEGGIPEVYKGADPSAAEFEARLWKDFWRLMEDPAFAKQHGVRLAQGDGKWWRPEEGKLYRFFIKADGGIELTLEPVNPIFIEAMKRLRESAATTAPAK